MVEIPASFKRRRMGETELVQVIDVVHPPPVRQIISEKDKITQYSKLPTAGANNLAITQPSTSEKRQHQLTWLANKFNADKDMLEERNSSGIRTKKEAWGKYGW